VVKKSLRPEGCQNFIRAWKFGTSPTVDTAVSHEVFGPPRGILASSWPDLIDLIRSSARRGTDAASFRGCPAQGHLNAFQHYAAGLAAV
jgi:hypothetical protein